MKINLVPSSLPVLCMAASESVSSVSLCTSYWALTNAFFTIGEWLMSLTDLHQVQNDLKILPATLTFSPKALKIIYL